MNTKKALQKILVPVTYILMIVANALANILPINGITTGAVSDSFPNLFAPAGITFAIWGVIYLLLGAYTVYQIVLKNKENNKSKKEIIEKINIFYVITSVVNTIWIFAWHYRQIGLTVILTLGLLVSLIKIADITSKVKLTKFESLFIRIPFAVYFGWVTVATIANITVWLVSMGWDGFGIAQEVWTIAVLLVGATIGIWRGVKDKSVAYLLVFVWAYFGIYLKHTSQAGFAGQYTGVIFTLILSIFSFIAVIIYLVQRFLSKK